MQVQGTYFDGQVAADRAVSIDMMATGLVFSGPDAPERQWRFGDLEAIDPPHPGHAFRLSHAGTPGARLVIHDAAFVASLVARAPHLKGGFSARRMKRAAMWVAATVAVIAALSYLVLQLAPQKLAFVLPDSWRDKVGAQVEASLTGGARVCNNPAGVSALAAMTARIADGNPDLPALSIRVYDIPVMNAFAMPGERIVLTRELIARADTPEEVAGVLTHEVGHVMHRHSEAQLVRATGLQILLSVATGGGSDTISSFAGLAAILRYSRGAEAEADLFAQKTMNAAAIDPMGLKRFFEKILREEGALKIDALDKIGSVLSTHPGTEERISKIEPLPPGVASRPVLTETQWQALKAICK